ncbi:YesK family protein [Bacillus sp. CGMCC 1.60114]|uniref:YesK family protein n=1 Tax=unclassified Bacillus (in: firmicutes) TaxID=185979 RepID=UPI00362C4763
MDEFNLFICIGITAFTFIIMTSWIIRKNSKSGKYDIIIGPVVIAASLIYILYCTHSIVGWEGVTRSFLGIFIIIGTVMGMLVNMIIKISLINKRYIVHVIGYIIGFLGCYIHLSSTLQVIYQNQTYFQIEIILAIMATTIVYRAAIRNNPELMCMAITPTIVALRFPFWWLIMGNFMYVLAGLLLTTEYTNKKTKQKDKRLKHFKQHGY